MKELKIRVEIDNAGEIEAAIKEAEGKARVRTIDVLDISRCLGTVECGLKIPKKYMKGIKVEIDKHAQGFPHAYRYTPESTHFSAEHNGKDWFLTGVWRGACGGSTQQYSITLPSEAKKAIIKSFETGARF